MDKQFSGKVALITGGNAGIGRAAAVAFAREGAKIVVSARRVEEGEQTIHMIRESGGEAIFVQADVSKTIDIQTLLDTTIATFGRLDFAFNNAGIEGTPFIPLADYSEEAWDEVIGINLKGVWLSMKYQIPHLLKQKGSAIVNMSSVAGLVGGYVGAAYYASKHGVVGLTKAAALEYAEQGLRVNAVAPAVIRTPMTERWLLQDPAVAAKVTAKHPIGRIGKPEEVAAAVLWLCSDAASFTTGHVLPIDGGYLAQ
jgi:NAD(P)-dependent dehydrogenase (short-subunit alcohol dehydrogenase family)